MEVEKSEHRQSLSISPITHSNCKDLNSIGIQGAIGLPFGLVI